MLIPSSARAAMWISASLSRRVNANSQHVGEVQDVHGKLIKKGEC